MAEFVQANIEDMAEELHYMQETKLFTKKEVKLILGKRKHFEYKCARHKKQLSDFLNYITYEKQLLSLLKLRRKEYSIWEHKEIELRFSERISRMFMQSCTRWPTDSEVWLARIQHATALGRLDSVSKLYRSMLQVIPNKPNLWIMAASYEFTEFDSVELARNILQEGISINKNSVTLWQEYLKLELLYVDMIRRKKTAEKLKVEVFLPESLRCTRLLDMDVSEGVLDGIVAERVYLFARQSLPDRFGMALEMAKIVGHFPWASKVEKAIYVDLLSSFAGNPLVTQTICQLKINKLHTAEPEFQKDYENVENFCNQLLRRLIKVNSSVPVWDCVLNVKSALKSAAVTLSRPLDSDAEFCSTLDFVYRQGNLSLHWAQKWVEMAKKGGKIDVLDKLVSGFKNSSEFWVTYLTNLVMYNADTGKTISTFHRARTALQSKELLPLWKCIVGHLSTSKRCTEQQLVDILELGVVSENDVTSYVKPVYIDWSIHHCSTKRTRKLFDRLCKLNPVPEEMLVNFIEFEQSQESPDNDRVRKIYEIYTTVHEKTSVDAWSGYTKFERLLGNGMRAAVIHSQAMKHLNADRIDEFLKRQIQPS